MRDSASPAVLPHPGRLSAVSRRSSLGRRLAGRLAVAAASLALMPTLSVMAGTPSVANAGFQATSSGTYLTGATAITAGSQFTCALVASGGVDCWGDNSIAELGDGTTTSSSVPMAVRGITTASAIAAGFGHACALLAGGTVKCWGANATGQLGDGTLGQSTTPVAVSGIAGAIAIVAGGQHTCALLSAGTVKCWGEDLEGELGDGTTPIYRSTPVAVIGLTGVRALAAGGRHTCALLSGGTVKCWGWNSWGQLGDGTSTSRSKPVAVAGLTGAAAIAAGDDHTCALLGDGSVACWGHNQYGELGNGTTTDSSTAVPVFFVSTVSAITGGQHHTCALLAAGSVDCWGYNLFGQLGDGTTTDSLTPTSVTVSGITTATMVAAGDLHTCALLAGGSVDCWGENLNGQLGNGSTTYGPTSTPVTVVGLTGSQSSGVTKAWLAKVGPSGVNGTASVAVVTPSAGSIGLKLVKLRASSTLPVTVYKGTCASVGPVLFRTRLDRHDQDRCRNPHEHPDRDPGEADPRRYVWYGQDRDPRGERQRHQVRRVRQAHRAGSPGRRPSLLQVLPGRQRLSGSRWSAGCRAELHSVAQDMDTGRQPHRVCPGLA